MTDIVLVTVECARWDYRDRLGMPSEVRRAKAIAPGHYTRPSLAGLHSSQYRSVIDTRVHQPTLASELQTLGYDTHAISFSPQTLPVFDFDFGFDTTRFLDLEATGGRGSALRERAAESRVLRRLKRRFRGKHATFENIPRDASVIEHARDIYRERDSRPVFCWLHLMGSHRPYGWNGQDQLPEGISRAAASAGEELFSESDTDALRRQVEKHYGWGLSRVGKRIRDLLQFVNDDALVIVAGDHGEELGEDGYFFHGGYRRRVVDELVEVPVFTRGLDTEAKISLLDIPTLVLNQLDETPPEPWDGHVFRDHYQTIAPWTDRATVRFQTETADLRYRDVQLDVDDSPSPRSRDLESQLSALGYSEVG